jgi:Na+/glutamate symporter
MKLLLGIIVATVGWIFIAQKLGPPLAKWLYDRQVARLRADRVKFPNPDLEKKWQQDTSRRCLNQALIVLAVGTGALAGVLNFPLIGISRSLNPWSWARVGILTLTSWVVTAVVWGL